MLWNGSLNFERVQLGDFLHSQRRRRWRVNGRPRCERLAQGDHACVRQREESRQISLQPQPERRRQNRRELDDDRFRRRGTACRHHQLASLGAGSHEQGVAWGQQCFSLRRSDERRAAATMHRAAHALSGDLRFGVGHGFSKVADGALESQCVATLRNGERNALITAYGTHIVGCSSSRLCRGDAALLLSHFAVGSMGSQRLLWCDHRTFWLWLYSRP